MHRRAIRSTILSLSLSLSLLVATLAATPAIAARVGNTLQGEIVQVSGTAAALGINVGMSATFTIGVESTTSGISGPIGARSTAAASSTRR